MYNYSIDVDKMSRGDIGEQMRFLYLVNPSGMVKLFKAQGFDVKNVMDVQKLYNDNLDGKNEIDFFRIKNDLPVSAEQISSIKDRVKIFRSKKVLNKVRMDRVNKIAMKAVRRQSPVIPQVNRVNPNGNNGGKAPTWWANCGGNSVPYTMDDVNNSDYHTQGAFDINKFCDSKSGAVAKGGSYVIVNPNAKVQSAITNAKRKMALRQLFLLK